MLLLSNSEPLAVLDAEPGQDKRQVKESTNKHFMTTLLQNVCSLNTTVKIISQCHLELLSFCVWSQVCQGRSRLCLPQLDLCTWRCETPKNGDTVQLTARRGQHWDTQISETGFWEGMKERQDSRTKTRRLFVECLM